MKTEQQTSADANLPNIDIDWLTVTFMHSLVPHELLFTLVFKIVARYSRDRADFIPGGARNLFRNRLSVMLGKEEVLTYAYGGNDGWAMIEIKGGFCALADDRLWRLMRWFVHRYRARITRIDIAADFFRREADPRKLQKIYRAMPEKVIECKSGKWPRLGVDDRGKGMSLYIGTRESPREICVYEKGIKEGSENPDWVRVEVRFRREKRCEIALDVLEPENWWGIVRGLGPYFRKRCPDGDSWRRRYHSRRANVALVARIEKQIKHVRDNYGKFLFFLAKVVGPENVVGALSQSSEWSPLAKVPGWENDGPLIDLLTNTICEQIHYGFDKVIEEHRELLVASDAVLV